MVKCSSPLKIWPKSHAKSARGPRVPVLGPTSAVAVEVRCGRCENCLAYNRQCWTGRILLEWLYRGSVGQLVTFTYRDGNLPDAFYEYLDWKKSGSAARCPVTLKQRLGVADFTVYLHRFKQACRDRGLPVPKIFWLSEHGERKDRPHHHALILGLDLRYERVLHVPSGVMESQLIGFHWDHGFINFEPMSSVEDAARRARYLTNYLTTKGRDFCYRGRGDAIGKEPIKAFFRANLLERYPDGLPAFVFSQSALDLRSAGLGIYPMQQSMQDWCKEEATRLGIDYLSPRIDNPYEQPAELMFFSEEWVKDYSQSEHTALGVYRRQCAAVHAGKARSSGVQL